MSIRVYSEGSGEGGSSSRTAELGENMLEKTNWNSVGIPGTGKEDRDLDIRAET